VAAFNFGLPASSGRHRFDGALSGLFGRARTCATCSSVVCGGATARD
jgi:hypothetical protein